MEEGEQIQVKVSSKPKSEPPQQIDVAEAADESPAEQQPEIKVEVVSEPPIVEELDTEPESSQPSIVATSVSKNIITEEPKEEDSQPQGVPMATLPKKRIAPLVKPDTEDEPADYTTENTKLSDLATEEDSDEDSQPTVADLSAHTETINDESLRNYKITAKRLKRAPSRRGKSRIATWIAFIIICIGVVGGVLASSEQARMMLFG